MAPTMQLPDSLPDNAIVMSYLRKKTTAVSCSELSLSQSNNRTFKHHQVRISKVKHLLTPQPNRTPLLNQPKYYHYTNKNEAQVTMCNIQEVVFGFCEHFCSYELINECPLGWDWENETCAGYNNQIISHGWTNKALICRLCWQREEAAILAKGLCKKCEEAELAKLRSAAGLYEGKKTENSPCCSCSQGQEATTLAKGLCKEREEAKLTKLVSEAGLYEGKEGKKGE